MAFNSVNGSSGFTPPSKDETLEQIYSIEEQSKKWFIASPYAFEFTDTDSMRWLLNLPINPRNLQITTHYATNVITTLYGTVEEHSEQRYFDITIEGTTGMAPKYKGFETPTDGNKNSDSTTTSLGRALSNRVIQPIKNAISAHAPATIEKSQSDSISTGRRVQRTLSGTVSAFTSGFSTDFTQNATQAVTGILTKTNKFAAGESTGLYTGETGYAAFHRLYRFFLQHKKTIMEKNNTNPLLFKCYKDAVKYKCVPTNFTLIRSVESPMLYNYQITLRAYDLEPLGKDGAITNTLESRKAELGLDGITTNSLFNILSKTVASTSAFIGTAKSLDGSN